MEDILSSGEEKRKDEEENPYSRLVEECCGLELFEKLMGHHDRDVYTLSEKLLKKYLNHHGNLPVYHDY